MSRVWIMLMVVAALALGGCAKDMSDLEAYMADVNARPGGRIEPLPQIKPYETYVYSASDLRSPFRVEVDEQRRPDTGIRPNFDRNREFLEEYPLDTLSMVGTLDLTGTRFALVRTAEGLIHRVRSGNHMGQNEGRIIEISDSEIRLVEVVSDGLGGYIERPITVMLSE